MISDLYASLTKDKLSICINFGHKYCKKIIKGFKIQVHTDCFFRFGKMVIIKFGYLSSINKVLKTSNHRNPNGNKTCKFRKCKMHKRSSNYDMTTPTVLSNSSYTGAGNIWTLKKKS